MQGAKTVGSSMGRSHSKHEDVSGGSHPHRNVDGGKTKEPKTASQDQNPHLHSSIQPSTSKGVKKNVARGTPGEALTTDKPGKKKRLIPKIIVTGPSEEVLVHSLTDDLPETKTIRDSEDYGPYTVHSKPSTVDAYKNSKEQ